MKYFTLHYHRYFQSLTLHFLLKHESCSMKRFSQCGIWIAIFLGISIGVALSTLNNMTTSDLEKQIIEGGRMLISISKEKLYFTMHNNLCYKIPTAMHIYFRVNLWGTILIACQFFKGLIGLS